jgi:hypothetical protein
MNDADLRSAVKRKLLAKYANGYPGTLVFEELGLRHGSGRIDLAVVNGTIHGFELKSDLDSLVRLPRQIQIYNSVLDKVTLIVRRRHVDEACELVPAWWGVKVATIGKRGGIRFSELRRAVPTEPFEGDDSGDGGVKLNVYSWRRASTGSTFIARRAGR